MLIAHKIELLANDEVKSYCRKAFGISRHAWNYCVRRALDDRKNHIFIDCKQYKKDYNALKQTEYAFTYEVTKYASQQPFIFCKKAINAYYSTNRKGKKPGFVKYKKKSMTKGSFYIGGDQVKVLQGKPDSKNPKVLNTNSNHQSLKIPNFGWVELREHIRFEGKILSSTISQEGDKFYASFNMEISDEEYRRTHKPIQQLNTAVGIDLGLKYFITTDNGVVIEAPKPLKRYMKKLKMEQRALSRKVHPRTKEDTTKYSKNYYRQLEKVKKLHRKIACIRKDCIEKVTTVLVRNYQYIKIEDLNVKGMVKNHKLALAISDVGFYKFRSRLECKAKEYQRVVSLADRFYPSSKTCSKCGAIKEDLTLKDRTYICPKCGFTIDRDLNAAINLKNSLKSDYVGRVTTEFMDVDRLALLDDFAKNKITTSLIEASIQ